jgi:hypothetical protein
MGPQRRASLIFRGVWTDAGLLQRKMLMWTWKTAESSLSEIAGVTVSRSDSGRGENVAQCATSLWPSLKGENELEKPWNAPRENDHPRREVYSAIFRNRMR